MALRHNTIGNAVIPGSMDELRSYALSFGNTALSRSCSDWIGFDQSIFLRVDVSGHAAWWKGREDHRLLHMTARTDHSSEDA